MSLIGSCALVLFCTAILNAQQLSHPVTASRDDAAAAPRVFAAVTDTVRILAAMVQFQQDADIRTTGDGRFVLTAASDPIIDSPPRDGNYFRNHLTFLERYYAKSSKGKTVVRWTLIDTLYTLPTVMATYSPAKNAPNTPVAQLARDAWQKVDASGRVPDFSQYTCFVLFHAGVGRDVDLIGILGYDPAPLDIPSLYIGPGAFATLLGGGVAVNGGGYTITNTIVMPETENRLLPGVGGDFQLELGINGLLCASVGNFLGLPDLFDTKTGLSGIGRFGLMDGQAIFSFAGLFPPEPSAWEKYRLGWIQPITVPVGTSVLSLPAVALADTVYRIPISDGEYYLVENRNRDPNPPGQTVATVFNGVPRQQFFLHDTAGFNAFDISGLAGNVTDVADLDWSLPGGVATDGTFYDGGILIWHIDEQMIRQFIAADQVNADPKRRGVDLEEADGSQDIGQQYDPFTAGSGSEEGTSLDFWFKGNNSPINKNEFSATSFPNTSSNLGALSHVTIDSFSNRGTRMTARVRRGDAITPFPGYPRQSERRITFPALTIADVAQHPGPEIILGTTGVQIVPEGNTPPVPGSTGGRLYILPADAAGSVAPFQTSGVAGTTVSVGRGFTGAPAVVDLDGDGTPEIISVESQEQNGTGPGMMRALSVRDLNADSLTDQFFATPFAQNLTTSPVVSDSLIVSGRADGVVYIMHFNGTIADSVGITTSLSGISRWRGSNAFVVCGNNVVGIIARNPSGSSAGAPRLRTFPGQVSGPAAVGLFGPDAVSGRTLIALTTSDGSLYLVDSTLSTVSGFPVSTGVQSVSAPVLADVDGDGLRDIVFVGGHRVFAYNMAGASLNHFPVTVTSQFGATSPLVGDVDGDGRVEIIAIGEDGVAYALTRDGTLATGFPLAMAGARSSVAILTNNGAITLVAASSDGSISAWVTGHYTGTLRPELYPWPQYGRDARHGGIDVLPLAGGAVTSDFFPKGRAYNWPNPVREGKTYFRYFVRSDAAVNIKIFDLAGDMVTELSGQGIGGVDNELPWDVTGVHSGVYIARIEATGQGNSGVALVKVAVVK